MLHRLNQTATLYPTQKDKWGTLTRLQGKDIRVRVIPHTATFKDGRGNLIDYSASMHSEVTNPLIRKGDSVEVEGRGYEVLSCTPNKRLNGEVHFQFAYLKEKSY